MTILPAAWDYARYAKPVRDAKRDAFQTEDVIRSAPPHIWPEAKEGSVIVLGRNRGALHLEMRRTEVRNAEETIAALADVRRKSSCGIRVLRPQPSAQSIPLGELMRIRIGAVTGDSDYFLLNEETRLSHQLAG